MATERGIVTRVTPTSAWVKTVRSDACAHCEARGSCNVAGDGEEVEVETLNPVGAGIGDRVVLTFETGPFLKASFLLYVFPILMMMVGGFAGQRFGPQFGLGESLSAVIGAFAFLAATFALVRNRANRLARTDAYRPKITRILRRT
ncbi:MAG: SoxR reducing system RseC family protein [Desulfobacterales bacterium]